MTRIMESRMEKNMSHEMETGFMWFPRALVTPAPKKDPVTLVWKLCHQTLQDFFRRAC